MYQYDVFLSYTSADKAAVETVARALQEERLRVFFDHWELVAGTHWQDALLEALRASRTCAVFLGTADGLGPWHNEEMRIALSQRVAEMPKRVIPVLLPGAEKKAMPELLAQRTWVDFRDGLHDQAARKALVAGIRGSAPVRAAGVEKGKPSGAVRMQQQSAALTAPPPWWRRARIFNLGISIAIIGVLLTTLTWYFPRQPADVPGPGDPGNTLDLYALRIQVIDPDGRPVEGSTIRVSSHNEPHLLPDGWWQIDIPRAKLPLNRQITLWAEHPHWKEGRMVLALGDDPNPQAEVRLQVPNERIAGIVINAAGHPLEGAHVSLQDREGSTATTRQDGRFELWVSAAHDEKTRLYAVHPELGSNDGSCYVGRDGCVLVLEPKANP